MFGPYRNEEDSETIGELTAENRLDRVTLYGSLELTRDKAGLAHAVALKTLVDATVAALKADPALPDQITVKAAPKVKNPFA